MATAWISEYEALPHGVGAQIAPEPPIAAQTVTFTTTTQSTAFGAKTRYIGFALSAAGHFLVGANPTATTSKMKLAADQIYFAGVQPGDKIAFVTAS